MIQKLIPIIALEVIVLIVLVLLWTSKTIDETLFAIGAIVISSISGAVVARSLRKPKP
jgi:hypothetical protein